jgi:transmembrane sensor
MSGIEFAKEMSKYRKILENWETPFNKSTEQAWEELQPKLSASSNQSSKVVSFSWRPLISVAAAAAIIVAVVVFWPKASLINHQTLASQNSTFTLPDGSEASLNAMSQISYEDDWSDERTLQLDGQAFFEVKKGSKFTVVTEQGLVEVLGTSFDVFARKDKFRVECRTGKVRVSLKSGKSDVVITPGNAAELNGNSLVISTADVGHGDWQTGEFNYENEPLQNVLDEISRQFGVVINSEYSGNRFYTGSFAKDNLSKALELVCLPMSLSFEVRNENQVFISEVTR